MPRPRRFRKISEEPRIRCFKPDIDDNNILEPVKLTIDEFEAIRLRDYHDIQQKRSAELMAISQPTFHRLLSSARKKIAKALVEGKMIQIMGGIYITENKRYKCNICEFEWINKGKEYDKCPECQSEAIKLVETAEELQNSEPLLQRRSYGGGGMGVGPPRVCKCPECGYEHPKTRKVPCRNTKCPKCEIPLCGAE
jgi:uncharacterized protein